MSSRVGVVGYHTKTGLGELNRQITTYADVDVWMVKPHAKYPMSEEQSNVELIYCPHGHKIDDFLACVDTVLFCELPFYGGLVERAKMAGKRVVCIPMQEWLPNDGWINYVDLFICPTKHCFNQCVGVLPAVYFPWPIDTQRFKPKVRTKAHRFLFINGRGGWCGRKGMDAVVRAKELWPTMPLTVISQGETKWPDPQPIIMQGPENNWDLYDCADVLLAPHSADGLGLELLEAMACGLPVISTLGEPWNEYPAIGRVRSEIARKRTNRTIDWYQPDPVHLQGLCERIYETDITRDSEDAIKWAQRRSWDGSVDLFNELVRSGKPCPYTIL